MGTGHGNKLDSKQELAIAALLSMPTQRRAAAKVGVSLSTLSRWLGQPEFRDAYRQARRRLVDDAVARLQRASGKAVEALVRNLKAPKAADQIRAALGVLEQAWKGTELADLLERLEQLENFDRETRHE
jgi:transposase